MRHLESEMPLVEAGIVRGEQHTLEHELVLVRCLGNADVLEIPAPCRQIVDMVPVVVAQRIVVEHGDGIDLAGELQRPRTPLGIGVRHRLV
ncbi:MAG: hypothetical protein ACK559_28355, partial [bacterium]